MYNIVHSRRGLLLIDLSRIRLVIFFRPPVDKRNLEKVERKISAGYTIIVFGWEIVQRNQRELGSCIRRLLSFHGDGQKLI